MTTSVRRPPQADDLLQIWRYIAVRDVGAADRLIDDIITKSNLLTEHPEIGPPRPDIGANVRAVSFRDHLIPH